ncbi:MAG: hypothetical protein ACOZNI_05565 [Myxococcota bacterium]
MLLLLALACDNRNACEKYVDAYAKCLEAAGVEVDVGDACADYEPGPQKDAYETCLMEAFDRDCSEDGELDAANEAAADCEPPA